MDKWLDLVGAEPQIALGLTLNSGKLKVGTPRKYLDETLDLIITVWFKGSPSKKAGNVSLQLKLQKWLAS